MILYSFWPTMCESCAFFLDSLKTQGEMMKQTKLTTHVLINVLVAPFNDIIYRMKIILFVLVKLVLGTNILRQVCCPVFTFFNVIYQCLLHPNVVLQFTEVTEQINRDLDRTHPSIKFFSDSTVSKKSKVRQKQSFQALIFYYNSELITPYLQESMRNILLLFAKLNPEISYVQGMNEILAPLYYVFSTDSDKDNAVRFFFYILATFFLLETFDSIYFFVRDSIMFLNILLYVGLNVEKFQSFSFAVKCRSRQFLLLSKTHN